MIDHEAEAALVEVARNLVLSHVDAIVDGHASLDSSKRLIEDIAAALHRAAEAGRAEGMEYHHDSIQAALVEAYQRGFAVSRERIATLEREIATLNVLLDVKLKAEQRLGKAPGGEGSR